MECKEEENLKDCPCIYPGCPRKGICCECIKYHLAQNELPACCFSALFQLPPNWKKDLDRDKKVNEGK